MNDAEMLLNLARLILYPRDYVITAPECTQGRDLARVQLALAFRVSSPSLRLRALFEDWDLQRINRELF